MSELKSLDVLFKLMHMLKRRLHAHIEQLQLDIAPMHVRVMKIIDKKAPCSAANIGQFLQRDKAQVNRLLKTLDEQGYIVRLPHPEDKRSQLLEVTNKGAQVLRQVAEAEQVMLATIIAGLSEQEQQDFQRIASQMAENLQQ